MNKNQLGQSDLYVSEIGFGTMSLPQNASEAIRLIHEAMDRGVNFIDTADVYNYGKIEEVVGKALKGKRDNVILASKGGNHWQPDKEGWYWDPSKDYIKEAFKNSLKRLNTDYLDLYQLHGGTMDDPIDNTIEAFEELKKEGLVRQYGISSIRPNVIREYVNRSSIVSVMMQYSLLDRRPEESILDLLEKNNISVIARGPVAKGILSEEGKNKVSQNGYLDYSQTELQSLIDKMVVSRNHQRLLSQTAIRYALKPKVVATAIPGASRIDQLVDNINTVTTPDLSKQEIHTLTSLTKANRYLKHR